MSRGLRLRVAVRDLRRLLTTLARSRATGVLGPVPVGHAQLVLRPPRLSDAAAWRTQTALDRERLQRWFPVDSGWDEAHSDLAWAEQVVGLRVAARLGRARPHVVLLDGRLVGQLGVDAVDAGTATGELSGWSSPSPLGHFVTLVGMALVCEAALSGSEPLDRLVAPVAAGNRGPGLLLARLGFERETTLTAYRSTGAERVDHDIWVLHRDPRVLALLRELVRHEGARPAALRLSARLRTTPVGTDPAIGQVHRGRVLARVAVRRARGALRGHLRPVTGWQAPLGPLVLQGHQVRLRAPELTDAHAMSALRRRNAGRLGPWFPAPRAEEHWGAQQTPLRWTEEVLRQRAAAARGAARPRVVEVDGELAGQWGVVAIDGGTGTGELELWLDPSATARFAPHVLSRWCGATVALDAFTCETPVERLQVPLAPGATAAAAVLAGLGFADEGRLRRHRWTVAGKVDHHLWVLHRTPETVAALRAATRG